MKKDSRKVMALMLLAAMTASMTAGCSGKSSETTSTTAAAQAAGTEAAGTEAATESGLEGSLISAEPKEFTIFDNFNNMPFDSNWQVWQDTGACCGPPSDSFSTILLVVTPLSFRFTGYR